MLTIGEFAHAAGLTVKALRHYDERGLLVPGSVDPATRHRRYGGDQLHDAVLIKALRAADVPVETVRAALSGREHAADLLDGFRSEIAATRAAQDRALDAADRLLEGFDTDVEFRERTVPAVHAAAVVHRLPADESEQEEAALAAEEQVTVAFHRLFGELERVGCPPDGPGWTQFDGVEDDPELIELSLHWPLPGPPSGLPDEVDGVRVRHGARPAARELVARMDCGDDAVAPDGLPHPALVALMAELARRKAREGAVDIGAIRQFVAPDAAGRMIVELAVPIAS